MGRKNIYLKSSKNPFHTSKIVEISTTEENININ